MDAEQKKDYELSFLINSPGGESSIFELVNKNGAQIYHESPVNQIKLAYPIEKQTSALFGFCYFNCSPESIPKIKQDLQMAPSVLRFLLITPPVKPILRQHKEKQPAEPREKGGSSEGKALTNEALEQKLEEILK